MQNPFENFDWDKWCDCVDLMYRHIYKIQIDYKSLTTEQIMILRTFTSRYPNEHFSEDYPDENGYTGDSWRLYRGIFFVDEISYNSFLENIKDNQVSFNKLTSWSVSPSVAETFAKGAGYYSYAPQDKGIVDGYAGLILRIEKVYKDNVLFTGYEAHEAFVNYLDEEHEAVKRKRTFVHEEEFVLLPATYTVYIEKNITKKSLSA